MCEGSVSKSKPIDLAWNTTSKVTWLLCPSRISRCRLLGEMPPDLSTLLMKCDIQAKNK